MEGLATYCGSFNGLGIGTTESSRLFVALLLDTLVLRKRLGFLGHFRARKLPIRACDWVWWLPTVI